MIAKILSPEKKIFDGYAKKIIVPGIDGELTLLPHHISFVTYMRPGSLTVFKDESNSRPIVIEVEGGVCSFVDNTAVIALSKGGEVLTHGSWPG